MSFHMPVLLNPLVNAVFNCPTPQNSPLKRLYQRLADKRFILLVPRTEMLLFYYDGNSGVALRDLCYNYEFVASHILVIEENASAKDPNENSGSLIGLSTFKTLNNKELSFKNRYCIQTKGFENRQKNLILDAQMLTNFNDYLPIGQTYSLLSVEFPLIGNFLKCSEVGCFKRISRIDVNEPKLAQEFSPLNLDVNQQDKLAFEKKVRYESNFWSKHFETLFERYEEIIEASQDICEKINLTLICQDSYQDLVKDKIFKEYGENVYNLAYDFIEDNLYAAIWEHLKLLSKNKEHDLNQFKYISMDNLDTTIYSKKFKDFTLKSVTHAEKMVNNAVKIFVKLNETTSHKQKVDLLLETLQILSASGGIFSEALTVDADTLMNLFLLVIIQSKVKNLHAHLTYIQNFAKSPEDIEHGALGYAVSTFEAALFLIEQLLNSPNSVTLLKKIRKQGQFVSHLEDDINNNLVNVKEYKSCLKYRSFKGDSILAICIKNAKNETFFDILLNYEDIFTIEDLLDDEDIDGSTLLMTALKCNNNEAAKMLIDILHNSCTEQELKNYYGRTDKDQRTPAHYLTNQVEILRKINSYITWTKKDRKGYTPLFTIFRAYDQKNYGEMIGTTMHEVREWYAQMQKQFSFADHSDNKGNTLLHILKNNILTLLKYEDINVNVPNKKGITPLMTFVKYNRSENVSCISSDSRLIVSKVQKSSKMNCFDFAKDLTLMELLGERALQETVFQEISIIAAKPDNHIWKLYYVINCVDSNTLKVVVVDVKTMYKFVKIAKKCHPQSGIPFQETLEILSYIMKMKSSSLVQKMRMKRNLRFLTNTIESLNKVSDIDFSILKSNEDLSQWIENKRKERGISMSIHNERRVLEPDDISTIKSFAQYNMKELSAIRCEIRLLKKLAIFHQLKLSDMRTAYKIFNMFGESFLEPKIAKEFSKLDNVHFDENTLASLQVLTEDISFFENITNNLFDNLKMLVQQSIPNWWVCYKTYTDLESQYSKYYGSYSDATSSNNASNRPSDRYSWGKGEAQERNLYQQIHSQARKLHQVGITIWDTHERLAEEISKYMIYKPVFFKNLILHKWTPLHIAELKEQLLILKSTQKSH